METYLNRITIPEIFGPGKWEDLHLYAFHARSHDQKIHYIRYVEIILTNIRCQECRQHALKYLKKHPLTDRWSDKMGMFYWSVDFHNWVNKRLGKPQVPRDVAYNHFKYLQETICTEGCGGKKKREEFIPY